jgi:hypothetical protein
MRGTYELHRGTRLRTPRSPIRQAKAFPTRRDLIATLNKKSTGRYRLEACTAVPLMYDAL